MASRAQRHATRAFSYEQSGISRVFLFFFGEAFSQRSTRKQTWPVRRWRRSVDLTKSPQISSNLLKSIRIGDGRTVYRIETRIVMMGAIAREVRKEKEAMRKGTEANGSRRVHGGSTSVIVQTQNDGRHTQQQHK
jgi:hypothetical protein